MKRKISLAFVAVLVCGTLDAQDARIKAITGATLIDGTGRPTLRDAVIILDGARIRDVGARGAVTVPAGAAVIDASGKFVIPGLADMHHHLQSGSTRPQQNLRSNLRRMLVAGITTVFDPNVSLAEFATLKDVSKDEASAFAHFFATGPSISVKGDALGELAGSATPDNAQQARAAVRELKAAGVDAIKIQYDDFSWGTKRRAPIMKADVLAAIVDEAHQRSLKVYAHAPLLKYAKAVLRAGGDGLLHGIIDEPVDQEFLDLMKRNRAIYVPTMALFNDVADVAAFAKRQGAKWDKAALQPPAIYEFFTTPPGVAQFERLYDNTAFTKQHLPVQKANVKKVFEAGVPVVLGTDSGFIGVYLLVSTQIELELLVDAGLTPAAALQTATINAARMIGRERDFGTVEAGKWADLVILDADPLADIRNIARVHRTFKGGVAYEPVDTAKPLP